MRKKFTLVALCLFLLCSFAACGGGTARYEAQAAQMLNASYYEDVEAAYALLHPEIGVTQEDYEKGFVEYIGLMAGVTWDHYEVLRVDTEGSLAEGKEYQESCRFAVTLRDEREMTLEYVYVKNSQGEGFMSFSLAGKQ